MNAKNIKVTNKDLIGQIKFFSYRNCRANGQGAG